MNSRFPGGSGRLWRAPLEGRSVLPAPKQPAEVGLAVFAAELRIARALELGWASGENQRDRHSEPEGGRLPGSAARLKEPPTA